VKKSKILQIVTEEINAALIPESADQSHRLIEGKINEANYFFKPIIDTLGDIDGKSANIAKKGFKKLTKDLVKLLDEFTNLFAKATSSGKTLSSRHKFFGKTKDDLISASAEVLHQVLRFSDAFPTSQRHNNDKLYDSWKLSIKNTMDSAGTWSEKDKRKRMASINKRLLDGLKQTTKWDIEYIEDYAKKKMSEALTESMIGIKTKANFKPLQLKGALERAGIKGFMLDRLSVTLSALKLDKKYYKEAMKIIDDLGLAVMMAKESVNETSLSKLIPVVARAKKGAKATGGGYGPFMKIKGNTWKNMKSNSIMHDAALISFLGGFNDFQINENKLTEISKEEKAAQFKFKLFLKKGLRLSVKDGEDKLYNYAQELDRLADDEYDEVVDPLFMAVELVQDAGEPGKNNVVKDKEYYSYMKSAQKHINTFQKNAKKAIKGMKESINEANIRKGDIIQMQDGEYGIVNKVKGRVAYIKLDSMPGSFHPIEAARITYKGKHKGRDVYSEAFNPKATQQFWNQKIIKAKTMKDVKKLYPKAKPTSSVHGAVFYLDLTGEKKLYAKCFSANSMKAIEPFTVEAIYSMKGKKQTFLYKEGKLNEGAKYKRGDEVYTKRKGETLHLTIKKRSGGQSSNPLYTAHVVNGSIKGTEIPVYEKDLIEGKLNEMDINDPILIAVRARKQMLAKAKAAPKVKKISTKQYYKLMDAEIDLINKIKDATKEYEQLDSDMNAEAGQKGDSWSDADANRYGGDLDKLQTKVEKLAKEKLAVKKAIINYRIN